MFDPETFLSTTFTEETSTRREPVPVGEYQATIDAVKPDVTQSGKALLRVTWRLHDASPHIDGRMVSQTIWLDLTDAGGLDLSKGMNLGLGRLRAALAQNTPGKPWQPGMMIGGVATVNVSHRADRDNADIIYDQIDRVAKAA